MPELTNTEQAAAEALWELWTPIDGDDGITIESFYDEARAVVAAVEPHHTIAALDDAEDALGHLAGFHEGAMSADWVDGVRTARKLISEQLDALRFALSRRTAEEQQ